MEPKNSHIDIRVTTESILRVTFVIIGVILLYLIRNVLAVLLFAVIIASAVTPAANYLQKKGWPRTLAVFLIYLVAFSALIGILYAIVAPLASEFDNISLTVPVYFDKTQTFFQTIKDTAPQYEQVINTIQDSLLNISLDLAKSASDIFSTTGKLFGGMASAVFVVVISFYLSA